MSDENRTDGKIEAGSVVAHSKVLRWLDNFWYHNKWTVIISAFFAVVLIVGLVQIFTKEAYDTSILYGGPYRMNAEERADFEGLIDGLCPSDYDGDGEKNVQYVIFEVYSQAEIEQAMAEAESESGYFEINTKYNQDEYKNFIQMAGIGEHAVCLLSPYLYETLKAADRLCSMEDLFLKDEMPEGVLEDGYGVALKDTDFYQYNAAVQVLPDDTVVCLLRFPDIYGNSQARKDAYAHCEALFRALVEFEVKE